MFMVLNLEHTQELNYFLWTGTRGSLPLVRAEQSDDALHVRGSGLNQWSPVHAHDWS